MGGYTDQSLSSGVVLVLTKGNNYCSHQSFQKQQSMSLYSHPSKTCFQNQPPKRPFGRKAIIPPGRGARSILSNTITRKTDHVTNNLDCVDIIVLVIQPITPRCRARRETVRKHISSVLLSSFLLRSICFTRFTVWVNHRMQKGFQAFI